MKKDPKIIAGEIMILLNELVEMAGGKSLKVDIDAEKIVVKKEQSGATGGLRALAFEGYFNEPKLLVSIIEKLKSEGRHYSHPTIAMGLLNLVRERVLTRIRENGKKSWSYVIRK